MFEKWSYREGDEGRKRLVSRLEKHLENVEILGFDIGTGKEVLEFLARMSAGPDGMQPVESLLAGAEFNDQEKEAILNLVEEKRGQLQDGQEK